MNSIGVMRKGRLLVEDSPDALLQQYNCDLLEKVVLQLCRKDENISGGSDSGSNNNVSISSQRNCSTKNYSRELMDGESLEKGNNNKSKNTYNVYDKFQENLELNSRRRSSIKMDECDNNTKRGCMNICNFLQRIQGLSIIMWLMLFRRPTFTVMTLFLPTIQLLLTLGVLGTDPKELRIGIVNKEVPNYVENCLAQEAITRDLAKYTTSLETPTCNFKFLSCNLIAELSRTGIIDAVPMQSTELAYEQVKEGNLWGYFVFPTNYSQHLANLVVEQKFAENETIEGSRVSLRMDMSSYLGAAIAIRTTFEAYGNYVKNLAISCGLDEREFQLPIMYREPVYGTEESSYHDYVTPIIILTVIFEVPMLITTILFIGDRKQGTLDRARIAGLKFKEVLIGYVLTQGSVAVGQTFICYAVMKIIFDFHVLGSIFSFFFLIILGGLCGLSMGLLLGILFQDEVAALMMGLLIGPTIILWEGAIWPVEALPWVPWRMVAYSSPTTLVCASIRSVISRGWGLTHPYVWPGVAVLSGYTILFWIISICFYIRKYK
ncbi:unnamed protein product [Orchesella dallaii]|uniref:ABC-2 type transporter transmembrane domain-containing protein n=1 Tax=Orchesella dallaii TaxID=48710 RepID=A0ABP1RD45_9HEXA